MALKPRHKRRIFWTFICFIGALFLAAIIIPPMITLNKFKPALEQSVYAQTSVPAKLNGDIHFSLIGGATIVAHDVVIPTANIGAVMFSIPFKNIFNLANPQIKDAVVIYDADIIIDKLAPASFNHNIEIYNSVITFKNRRFYIVRADFTNGEFHGIIRTKNHKYEVEFIGDTFHIRNKNNSLDITGQMYTDGTVRGHISLETDDLNGWFGFSEPKIDTPIKLEMNFEWDGNSGYKFSNIDSDLFSGNIEISPNGERVIQLVSNDLTFDFSFLKHPTQLMYKTTYNLDFYGHLKFENYTFNHLKIVATGTSDKIQIANIIADDIAITGGTITKSGASDIMITMPLDGTTLMCLFSGTPDSWKCSKFSYGNFSGTVGVTSDKYDIFIQSTTPMPSSQQLLSLASKIGTHGTIKFKFSDIAGTYTVTQSGITPTYDYVKNKNLAWLNPDLPFLPKFMFHDLGDFVWHNGMLTFTPHNQQWQLSTYDNYFYLTGTSYKSWFPTLDLISLNDAPYTISGFYDRNTISGLDIKISNHNFTGSLSNKNLTLHTDILDLDNFISQDFINRFSELEFLTNLPILIPFNLDINIGLSANSLIYDGNEYQNFIYTLKPNAQTFSITDSNRGNLLATLERDNNKYDLFIQLNRFVINGYLLSQQMPLNIRDTMITGQIIMSTSGQIAHDIYYNLNGTLDLNFDDGFIWGLSFDDFYASANNITSWNAEYALSAALSGGETRLKSMRIIGQYSDGNFITTSPIILSMRHTDAIGGIAITDGFMTAEFDLTLRGTAPTPAIIQLGIAPDGGRSYSLSDVMRQLDTSFMRAFIKTHDAF